MSASRARSTCCAPGAPAEPQADADVAPAPAEPAAPLAAEARAAADARLAIDGSREPRAGRMPADAGWGDAIARVFKQ
jgi:hypothetical protein